MAGRAGGEGAGAADWSGWGRRTATAENPQSMTAAPARTPKATSVPNCAIPGSELRLSERNTAAVVRAAQTIPGPTRRRRAPASPPANAASR